MRSPLIVICTESCGSARFHGQVPGDLCSGMCTRCGSGERCGGCCVRSVVVRPTVPTTAFCGCFPDYRDDWDGWPEGMANVEPPICRPCAATSLRLCPRLRRGAAAVRVRTCPIVGVRGALYAQGRMVSEIVVGFDDPLVRWVRAVGLVRQLRGCVLTAPDELGSILVT